MGGAYLYGSSLSQWGRVSNAAQFWGFPYMYGYTLCRRPTNAVTHMGRELIVFSGSAMVTSQMGGAGAAALPNSGVFYLWLHSLKKNDQTGRGNIWGMGLFLGGQPRHASQGGVALADANFAGSSLLMRTLLDLERPKSAW